MTNVLNTNVQVKSKWVETGVYNNGASLLTINDSYPSISETRTITRTGGNTPGYHNPNRAGSLKPTVLNYRKEILQGETGYDNTRSTTLKPNQYNYRDLSQRGDFGGQAVPSSGGISDSDVSDIQAKATNQLLSAIKSQSVNMAQGFGEKKQTFRLIGDTAYRLADSIRALRRGDIHQAARDLGVLAPKRASSRFKKAFIDPRRQGEAVSRAWLELQYGWKPLLSDVYGLAEQLAKQSNRPMTNTVRTRKKLAKPISYRTTSKDGKAVGENVRTGEDTVVVTIKVSYRVTQPAIASAKETGLTNPALLAWELLPFSFVADWFYPFGSFLGTLDATLGCVFDSGYRSVHRSTHSKAYRSLNGIDSVGNQRNMLKWSSQEMVSYNRVVLTDFPSVTLPPFKNPASLLHAANAVALVTQLFRK